MRLTSGGIRELHWHVPAEWAYMIYGKARITAVDSQGRSFVQDVGAGDLWYFPSGIPHSIQGLAPDGCEFLLVFDDGGFSEFDTFQISDWMAHTPREVLAKNFGVPTSSLNPIPEKELYIFEAPLPAELIADQHASSGPQGSIPVPYFYRLGTQEPAKRTKGGEVRIADSKTFGASTTIAAAVVTVRPGGLRELHWHPNADEWQYYIAGKARMTVFAASGRARTMDFASGDVGYVLRSTGHYIENTGDSDLVFIETFKSSYYQDISLSQWIAHTPPQLIAEHLHIDKATLAAIPREKAVVVPL
jgi:oxalate decarboxylase